MAYLLDSSTLIQAKNEYYGFDFCPGFWDWLDRENAAENVFSIDRIGDELEESNDELATWASERAEAFFLPVDDATHRAMRRVSTWVQNADYRDHAKREFLRGADPFLIAYALAHGHTVATHEVHVEGEKKKVKIPSVCRALKVPCVRTFEMLRREGARFVIARRSRAEQ
jgi:hypothetical protein